MTDYLFTEDFTLYAPVASKANDEIASLTIAQDSAFKIIAGYPLTLRLPALFGTLTTDSTTATGSLALGKQFAEPSYWSLNQVIAVYDDTAGTYLTFDSSGTTTPAAGYWSYNAGTVYVHTSAVSSNVYIYAVPFQYPVKVVADMRQPGASLKTTVWRGASTSFLVNNLGKSPVTFSNNADLSAGDRILIEVTSADQTKPFTPFLPDGKTPVSILEITLSGVRL